MTWAFVMERVTVVVRSYGHTVGTAFGAEQEKRQVGRSSRLRCARGTGDEGP